MPPIYEYDCSKCKKCIEVTQKISDKPLKKCPECGKIGLVKVISRSSFSLVGGGWFKDNYAQSKKTTKKDKE